MTGYEIVFNRPSLAGEELAYISEALSNGHISGDGEFTKRCHSLLENELGVGKALLTTSCTHALELAALLLDVGPGDEIIVPDFTFVSTVNAFVLRGAKPVFADIRPDTLNLDEQRLEALITPRTKAIVVVHYAGVACEMDAIRSIAEKYGIAVVEDNAHGLFGKFRGRYLGTFGCLATQSFHETKNFTCGEGGAILINDPALIERAEVLREKGTDRSRFFRGQVDKYSWVDIGSSYLPSDLLAAYLLAQLQKREVIHQLRRQIWEWYMQELSPLQESHRIGLPFVPEYCQHPYHMFYLLLPSLQERQALIAHLKAKRILAVFHYLPLHLSQMGKRFGGKEGDCAVTEDVSDRLVRLPFYNSLTREDQMKVVNAVWEYFDRSHG